MAATGERKFSTADVAMSKQSYRLPVPGDYECKILGSSAVVKKSDKPGSIPYVSVRFELLGTPPPDNDEGKNIALFHMLFCSGKPQKDGALPYSRQDQLKGLCAGLGEEFEGSFIELQSGDESFDCVNPTELKKWVEDHDGMIVKARVKIQKGTDGYEDKGVISRFEEAEEAVSAPIQAAAEEVEEEEEEAEMVEEAPPPKKAAPKSKGKK